MNNASDNKKFNVFIADHIIQTRQEIYDAIKILSKKENKKHNDNHFVHAALLIAISSNNELSRNAPDSINEIIYENDKKNNFTNLEILKYILDYSEKTELKFLPLSVQS